MFSSVLISSLRHFACSAFAASALTACVTPQKGHDNQASSLPPASQAASKSVGSENSTKETSDQAEENQESAQEYQPFERMLRYGEQAENRRSYTLAAQMYQAAHQMQPQEAEPLRRLVRVHKHLDKPQVTAIYYNKLLLIEPDNHDALVELGRHNLRQGAFAKARVQFNRALELSESAHLYNSLGVSFDMEGNHHKAQPYYRAALEIEPQNLTARSNLGLSLVMVGETAGGIKLLEGVVADPGAEKRHHAMLARALVLVDEEVATEAGLNVEEGASKSLSQ